MLTIVVLGSSKTKEDCTLNFNLFYFYEYFTSSIINMFFSNFKIKDAEINVMWQKHVLIFASSSTKSEVKIEIFNVMFSFKFNIHNFEMI